VFYAILYWMWHPAQPDRKRHMEQILPFVRFPQMEKPYLLDIVPHVATFFPDPIHAQIRERYREAMEYLASPTRYLRLRGIKKERLATSSDPQIKQFVPRQISQNKKFCMKCQFSNVPRWNTQDSLYSSMIVSHGYEFYYFLRSQPAIPGISVESVVPEQLALAGFLRCTSKVIPPKHFLPVTITVVILMRGIPSERKFTTCKVVFEESEKAIGGKLTLDTENWAQVVGGQCPLVIDDTITALVTVEFLDCSGEDCKVINVIPDG